MSFHVCLHCRLKATASRQNRTMAAYVWRRGRFAKQALVTHSTPDLQVLSATIGPDTVLKQCHGWKSCKLVSLKEQAALPKQQRKNVVHCQ